MNFDDALAAMRDGVTVARTDKQNEYSIKEIFVLNNNPDLTEFEFSKEDILADDWEIIE